jgi:hypothetical protein
MEPTPSTPAASNPTPPESASAPEPERSEDSPSFFDRLFRPRAGTARGEAAPESQDQPARESAPASSTPEPPSPPDDWQPPSSREEFERIYQSRRDKERADEQRRTYQQEQQERASRIAGLEQQRRELLASHQSWEVGEEVAELDRQILAEEQGTAQQDRESSLLGTVTGFYDQIYGDAYLAELPVAEQERILATPYQGPEGRAQLAKEILSSLKKNWLAEGAKSEREKFEKNPAVRKQLAHEFGITSREEPDHVPAANGSNGQSPSMNAWLRSGFHS